MVSTVIKMYPPAKLKKLQITQHIEALLPYTGTPFLPTFHNMRSFNDHCHINFTLKKS